MRYGETRSEKACLAPGSPRGLWSGRMEAVSSRVMRGLVPVLLLLLLAYGCAKYPSSTASSGTASGQAISRTARSVVGTPYRHGGISPATGFECSGLVCWAYAKNGVSLPRTAAEQQTIGKPVRKRELKPGDVVVFKIRRGMHTGIYAGNGKFIHSPRRGKTVSEDDMNTAYWKAAFIEGRRHRQVQ